MESKPMERQENVFREVPQLNQAVNTGEEHGFNSHMCNINT